VTTHCSSPEDVVSSLRSAGLERGVFLSVAFTSDSIALASDTRTWVVAQARSVIGSAPASERDENPNPGFGSIAVIALIEEAFRPRWVWWSSHEWEAVLLAGLRVATCWDLAAVHRLLFGGWRAEPARIWAALQGIPISSIPAMGQMGLLDAAGDEGADTEDPLRPDGHLRPEWTDGGWVATPERMAAWAGIQLRACALQRAHIALLPGVNGAEGTARSESAAELLCRELETDGLPLDVTRATEIIAASVGPRPRNEIEAAQMRQRRDDVVLSLARSRAGMDLRNPGHVKTMLAGVGIDVSNTRKWKLEPFRHVHPFVDALLTWRKAERIGTTYGYLWLDEHVRDDGRLRGAWTSCDGAAGRMTASAGLHNLPAEMRPAIIAKPGFVFVHADLGQIEPRVLAAVSGDEALADATLDDDLYAPVAKRLGVERPVAKIAVLAAMYGQTSGAAGEALRGMETNYPVAMQFLRTADVHGQGGRDVRTYGGRLVKMSSVDADGFGILARSSPFDATVESSGNRMVPQEERSVSAARGRYARNAVIQGAAAELFKAWAVTVRGRLAPFNSRIVLCLHDELLIHVPAEHGAAVAQLLEEALPQAARRWMPESIVRYVAKASLLQRWSEAKG
jgi:DNA polymerase I